MPDKWDVALLAPPSQLGSVRLQFPRAISRGMMNAGYTRAIVRVTDDGLLVTPYVSGLTKTTFEPLALPDWNVTGEHVHE